MCLYLDIYLICFRTGGYYGMVKMYGRIGLLIVFEKAVYYYDSIYLFVKDGYSKMRIVIID